MRYQGFGVAFLLLVAGCGQNAAKLARNADPKVCATSDVKDTMFDILKEHSGLPLGEVKPDTGIMGKDILDAISMTISDVTSTKVDKDAQTVDCSATLHFTAAGTSASVDSNTTYEVKPDLSDNGKIIVTVTPSDGEAPVMQIAGPLFDAKLAEKDAAQAKEDANKAPDYTKMWIDGHQSDIAKSKAMFATVYGASGFSADDQKRIIDARTTSEECIGSTGDEHRIICKIGDALPGDLRLHNLCHDNGDWHHCDGPDLAVQPAGASNAQTSDSASNVSDTVAGGDVQVPCQIPGHSGDGGCIVVKKVVVAISPATKETIDTALARAIQGKTNHFSIIYSITSRAYRPGDTPDGSVDFEQSGHSMMSDVHANSPTLFWINTTDGGKSWSKLMTTDMGSVISY